MTGGRTSENGTECILRRLHPRPTAANAGDGAARAPYQLIDAAKLADNLSTIVDILPRNEAQARELATLKPEQQRACVALSIHRLREPRPRQSPPQPLQSPIRSGYKDPHVILP